MLMADNGKHYKVWFYDEERGIEDFTRCVAENADEAMKKSEWYIPDKVDKITRIEECRFQPGGIYVIHAVEEKMLEDTYFALFVIDSINRYVDLDWGDTCEEDAEANDDALIDGDRILAAYTCKKTGEKIWIITEAYRSVTTVLFPEEY